MVQNAPVAVEEATKTIKMIEEGKNKKLLTLIPEGQSPKLYLDLIKSQIMKPDANGKPRSDEDLLLFLYVAKRTGLDPLAKQIYAVFRWDSRQGKEVMGIQTGIDGFRLIAQSSGQYAGSDDAVFTPEDEGTKYPTKATVTVYKIIKGMRVAFTATARWNEYVQKKKDGSPMGMWASMPYAQLAKCAEALALRKGFPNELSGLYTSEEMDQASNPTAELPVPESIASRSKVEVISDGAKLAEPIKEVEPMGAEEAKKVSQEIKAKLENDAQKSTNTTKTIAELRKDIAERGGDDK